MTDLEWATKLGYDGSSPIPWRKVWDAKWEHERKLLDEAAVKWKEEKKRKFEDDTHMEMEVKNMKHHGFAVLTITKESNDWSNRKEYCKQLASYIQEKKTQSKEYGLPWGAKQWQVDLEALYLIIRGSWLPVQDFIYGMGAVLLCILVAPLIVLKCIFAEGSNATEYGVPDPE